MAIIGEREAEKGHGECFKGLIQGFFSALLLKIHNEELKIFPLPIWWCMRFYSGHGASAQSFFPKGQVSLYSPVEYLSISAMTKKNLSVELKMPTYSNISFLQLLNFKEYFTEWPTCWECSQTQVFWQPTTHILLFLTSMQTIPNDVASARRFGRAIVSILNWILDEELVNETIAKPSDLTICPIICWQADSLLGDDNTVRRRQRRCSIGTAWHLWSKTRASALYSRSDAVARWGVGPILCSCVAPQTATREECGCSSQLGRRLAYGRIIQKSNEHQKAASNDERRQLNIIHLCLKMRQGVAFGDSGKAWYLRSNVLASNLNMVIR